MLDLKCVSCSVVSDSLQAHGLWPATRILEWVAIPFSRGSSQTRDSTQVSWIAGRFFSVWVSRNVWNASLGLSAVQFSCSVVSDSLRPHESQHTRPLCPSQTPGVHSNSCPSSRWCHPAISSSVAPFSSCRQSLPASGSFPKSQLLAWGGQSIGVSASASVLPMNTLDLSPSGWTGCISLQSKGLSRVFSNTWSTAVRSYPSPKVRGSNRECQAATAQERRHRGASLRPR